MFKTALNTITNIIEPGTTIDDYSKLFVALLSIAFICALIMYPLIYVAKFFRGLLMSTCNIDSIIFSYLLGIAAALVIFYLDPFYLLVVYLVLYAMALTIGSGEKNP
jgi:hypothetical protein